MFNSKESESANQVNKKIPTLDFDDKKYDINSLPEEVKDLLKGLQIADTQIRMHKDTLRLLELGKNSLGAQLKQKLKNITPVEN
tara:strand:- start:121 stop:372 length:252 start_codon:yes stop_codon:yes gene_type:complete